MKKHLRTLCAAFILTAALSLPAFAGEIGTGRTDPPPPPPSAAGEIGTGMTNSEASTAASLTEAALSLLRNVLALF